MSFRLVSSWQQLIVYLLNDNTNKSEYLFCDVYQLGLEHQFKISWIVQGSAVNELNLLHPNQLRADILHSL